MLPLPPFSLLQLPLLAGFLLPLPFLFLLLLLLWVLSLPWRTTRRVCWDCLLNISLWLIGFWHRGGSDFAALVRPSFPHLLPDLSRDFTSDSSLFLTTLRSAPATPSPPTSSATFSSASHPSLSAHLSSSRLAGGLTPPPSSSLSPAFPPPAPPSSAVPAPPGFPPLSASASLGSGSSHMVPGLGVGVPRFCRLLTGLDVLMSCACTPGLLTSNFLPFSSSASLCLSSSSVQKCAELLSPQCHFSLFPPTTAPPSSSSRAHSIRAISTSVAFSRNVPLASILAAVTWSSSTVFTSFYLRDVQFSSSSGFSLGPVVAGMLLFNILIGLV